MDMPTPPRGGAAASWRIARWSAAAALLLLPLVAMRFSREVRWTGLDFAVMGGLLAAACGAYELAAWRARRQGYRAAYGLAAALAILAAFGVIWANLAVGLIGTPGDPANLAFLAVLAIGIAGAALSRLRAAGMARTLLVMAVAQALVAAMAGWMGGEARPGAVLALLLTATWLSCAWLFRVAARPGRAGGQDADSRSVG